MSTKSTPETTPNIDAVLSFELEASFGGFPCVPKINRGVEAAVDIAFDSCSAVLRIGATTARALGHLVSRNSPKP